MNPSRYQPGQSGNPNGRPKDKTSAAIIRKAIAEDIPDIMATVIAAAKSGDMQACKILLDRVCPPLKPQALPISIPIGSNLSETGGNVINATLDGQVPPDIGSQLVTALTNQGKLLELQEIAERLKRLEKVLENRT